ncbi:MAG: M23 family metallopeptidase [Candidatus Tectomicrobia bacterium]|nr:M23 family metallopeptidase [Candidatus Tectomicrobia bacterium]
MRIQKDLKCWSLWRFASFLFLLLPILSLIILSTPQEAYPAKMTSHTIKKGENPWDIARAYGVSLQALLKQNNIRSSKKLQIGQQIVIPEKKEISRTPGQVTRTPNQVASRPPKEQRRVKRVDRPSKSIIEGQEINLQEGIASKEQFTWPLSGEVRSLFGYRGFRYHSGIDISARSGTPFRTAASGRVVFSGWGPRGYGNVIRILHPNGYMTMYAHNMTNLVRENQFVRQGEIIGIVGMTGRTTGPHLHFEVIKEEVAMNPLRVLPSSDQIARTALDR